MVWNLLGFDNDRKLEEDPISRVEEIVNVESDEELTVESERLSLGSKNGSKDSSLINTIESTELAAFFVSYKAIGVTKDAKPGFPKPDRLVTLEL